MFLLQGTRLRRKLLTHSFNNPDKSFYVRELSHLINEDAGNLSRELSRLEQEGMYISTVRGNMKFYALNKQYPLYNEIKGIIFRNEDPETTLKGLVRRFKGVQLAFIYGPYAENRERKGDINIVVVGEFDQNAFVEQLGDLETKLSRKINFLTYSREEFSEEKDKEGSFLNLSLRQKIIILSVALPE
jgi:hypothetical protein